MDPKLYKDILRHKNDEVLVRIRNDNRLKDYVTKLQENTILHVAAISGNLEFVREMTKDYPTLINKKNKKGDTALHVAARLGHLRIVEFLTERKLVPTDAKNDEDNTALHEAVLGHNFRIADCLIRKDKTLATFKNRNNESALFMAVDRGFHKIAKLIVGSDSYSAGGSNGMNAIQAAAVRSQNGTKTHWLLKTGHVFYFYIPRGIMKVEEISNTASAWLRSWLPKDESTLVTTLWNTFNDPKILETEILKNKDVFEWTCLHYFAHLGKPDLVNKFFLDDQCRLVAYEKDKNGMTALHIAARDGQVEVAKALIENCPDVCECLDNRKRTALHVAAECGKENVAHILIKSKAFSNLLNEKDNEGNTALHISASFGYYQIVELLTGDRGVDLGAVNNAGRTALDVILDNTRPDKFFKVKSFALVVVRLKISGCQRSLGRGVIRPENGIPNNQVPELKEEVEIMKAKKIKHTAQISLIVATIIASITFTAGISMPGGFDHSGSAILRKKGSFVLFLIFDSIAFGLAASSMFIHFMFTFMSGSNYTRYPHECISLISFLLMPLAMLAFFFGTNAVLWKHTSDSSFPGYIAAICFMSPVFYTWVQQFESDIYKFYLSKMIA